MARSYNRPPPAREATIPASIGGWNARDPLSGMKATDAIIMENWIPGTGGVALRKGYSTHLSDVADPVETLMEYSAPSGVESLFAAAGDSIYDATVAGTAGAAVLTTLTNARWQHTMFATAGGNFLVACNGADNVVNYDGSNWTAPSITGATSADLIHVMAHQSRLWFIEKDSLSVWYLGTSSIAGAATELDLGAFCKLGGSLLALGSWTRDGGSGSDDVAVFITNRGEVLVFSGTDPSDSTTWVLNGVFRIPEPIGRRCVIKIGAELAVITSQGVLPLSEVLPAPESSKSRGAITDKVKGAFNLAYQNSGALFGWQMIEYPQGGLLFVNVPLTTTTSEQFVMNMITGAWCKFTNLNAQCFSLLGADIYFGTADGTVWKYGTDFLDDADPVEGRLMPAFTDFGLSGLKKHFKQARPLFIAPEGTRPPLTLKTDYDATVSSLTFNAVPAVGTIWDQGDWDTSSWGPAQAPNSEWQLLQGLGLVCTIYLGVSSQEEITLFQTDILYEAGGVL